MIPLRPEIGLGHHCDDCKAPTTPPTGVDYRAAGVVLICGPCARARMNAERIPA